MFNRNLSRFRSLAIAVLSLSVLASSLHAAEPAEEFLTGLREKGFYDLALAYIDRMEKSNLAPQEFKESIGFEKARTMILAARLERDLPKREQQLDEAQTVLREFVATHANHHLSSSAQTQLGNLLVERARMKVEQIKRDPGTADTRRPEARKLYEEAHKLFSEQVGNIKKSLSSIRPNLNPKDPADQRVIRLRDRLRADYLQAQLLSAVIKEETAETAPEGSDDYKALLKAAADEFAEIYEKYRTRSAGLYARMFQARCYQKMGEHKQALTYLADLLEQPDAPDAFRTLKLKTVRLAMDSWLDPEQAKYLEATAYGDRLVDTIRPAEAQDPEWLQLEYFVAKGHWEYSKLLHEKKQTKDAKSSENKAEKLARLAARYPNEKQKDARDLLEVMGRFVRAPGETEPETFVEAKDAGKAALISWQTAPAMLKALPARIAKEADPEEKKKLEQQLAEATTAGEQGRQKAIKYFEQALVFADEDTQSRELNVVQYYLAYLHYTLGEHLKAGVIGEFVSRRYPSSDVARHCGKISLASYVQLHTSSTEEEKSFETKMIVDLASYLAQRWPSEQEGILAAATLVPFLLRSDDSTRAAEIAEAIPEGSDKRGPAEMKVGQAMWNEYLRGYGEWVKMPDGEEKDKKTAELDAVKAKAEQLLAAGLNRVKADAEIDQKLALSTLSLGQIYVFTNQPEKALVIFEDPRIGPLTLLGKEDPSVQREGYATEVYRAGLRAYVGALANAEDPAQVISRASAAMAGLKKEMATDPAGQDKLIGIYMSMAKSLRAQMDAAQPAKREKLAQGFQAFLNQVASDATDFDQLYWVAETFYSMGDGLRAGAETTPAEAKKYYKLAGDAYEKILAAGTKDPSYYPAKLKGIELQITMRIASAKRQQGDFEEAVETFANILKKNNSMLNVQVEAARALQDWAAAGQDEKYFIALRGDRLNATNDGYVIWGWAMIAKRTAQSNYEQEFFEARYNIAFCRLKHADTLSGEEKTEELKKARSAITSTMLSYPTLGGEAMEKKFDLLLIDIQKAIGEPAPHGLKAERDRQAAKADDAEKSITTTPGETAPMPTP